MEIRYLCDTCGKNFTELECKNFERPADFPAIRCDDCYQEDLAQTDNEITKIFTNNIKHLYKNRKKKVVL